jgi:hypothetical protein
MSVEWRSAWSNLRESEKCQVSGHPKPANGAWKKSITTIAGLESNLDLKLILKNLRKTFATNGTQCFPLRGSAGFEPFPKK